MFLTIVFLIFGLQNLVDVQGSIDFDHSYLKFQGFQIAGALEAKSVGQCWKEAYDNLKKDCRGKEEKLILWVRMLYDYI